MSISEFQVNNFFGEKDRFDYQQGFNIAVGLSGWNDIVEYELPPEIGYISYGASEWGIDDNGLLIDDWYDFESHTCTPEELGLTDDRSNATFYTVKPLQRAYVEKFQKKLQCINKQDLTLWGDFQSVFARQFNIFFVKCTDKPECKTDAEIKEYLSDKYIMILSNEMTFDNANFGQKSILKQADLKWKRFNTQVIETIPFEVTQTSVELQDLLLDLDSVTALENENLFYLKEM